MEITGSPAPTDDSWNTLAPDVVAVVNMSFHSWYEPEKAFLLGVTMLMPRLRSAGTHRRRRWS